jgi:hypothetical protein
MKNNYYLRVIMLAGLSFSGLCVTGAPGRADAIMITGAITQDPADGGVTSTSNPTLINVTDGDAYSVNLNFSGAITTPGTFNLTSILFSDPTNSASESAFISGSMTITQSAGVDTFSVFGCLISPSACLAGNQLDLNFAIPSGLLNSTGVTAQAVPALTPLDLLEDSGNTDIQGTVTGYSYQAVSGPAVPEPSMLAFLGLVSVALLAARPRVRRRHSATKA